jgi:hypothetical protein
MMNINWPSIRAKLREAILILPHFFKNPVQGMRTLPDWDWPTILILQGAFSAACALLANLVERDIFGMITGLVIAPVANYLMVSIGAGLFFYTFMFFFQREVPYRQIYVHLIFAAIPVQVVMIVAGYMPPILLLGAAAMMMLLYVGFTENFHLDRPKLKKLLLGLICLYALFWAVQIVRITSKQKGMRLKATPETLDILEKEFNSDE